YDLLVDLDDLDIRLECLDSRFDLLACYWSEIITDELFVLGLVSGIIKSLAHCLLGNIRAILGRTRGQDVRPADGPRGAQHLEHTFRSFRASKGADFRQIGKMRMLFPLRRVENAVKSHEPLFDEFWRTPQQGVRKVWPGIHFATLQSEIDLRPGIAGDEF